jgi:hypothetical protein
VANRAVRRGDQERAVTEVVAGPPGGGPGRPGLGYGDRGDPGTGSDRGDLGARPRRAASDWLRRMVSLRELRAETAASVAV